MQKSIQVLLIEDDYEDVELFGDILNDLTTDYSLQVIKDGGELENYLQQENILPHVIVMDFNLPKIHGREILKLIKTNDLYIDIPVVVLTTSSAPEDKQYALDMGAIRYFVKPNSPKELQDIIRFVMELCMKEAD
jgi:CheY-like chemotaxis protein